MLISIYIALSVQSTSCILLQTESLCKEGMACLQPPNLAEARSEAGKFSLITVDQHWWKCIKLYYPINKAFVKNYLWKGLQATAVVPRGCCLMPRARVVTGQQCSPPSSSMSNPWSRWHNLPGQICDWPKIGSRPTGWFHSLGTPGLQYQKIIKEQCQMLIPKYE